MDEAREAAAEADKTRKEAAAANRRLRKFYNESGGDTTGAPDTPPASAGPEPPPNPFAALEQPQDLEAVPEEDEFVDAVNEDEPVIMVNYDMRNEAKEPADIMSKLDSIKVEWETKEDRRDIQFFFHN